MLTAINKDPVQRDRTSSLWKVIDTVKSVMDDSEEIEMRIQRLGTSMVIGGLLRFCTSLVVMALIIVQPGSYGHLVKELVAVLIGVTTCWFGVLGGYKNLEYPTRLFFVTELFMMTILSTFLFSVVDSEAVTSNMCNPQAGNYAAKKAGGPTSINFALLPPQTFDCSVLTKGPQCPNTTVVGEVQISTSNADCDFELGISRAKVAVAVFDLIMALFNVMWAMDFNDALNDDSVNKKIDDRIRRSKSTGDEFILSALSRMPGLSRAPVMKSFADKLLMERYFKNWASSTRQRMRSPGRAPASNSPDRVPPPPVTADETTS
jgi:hypothetical protein